ncbi:MAG TPA: manganese efflux pump [Pseudonocardia sp.]|nr:manganese efflux pump [Pseudonocardia sp.]
MTGASVAGLLVLAFTLSLDNFRSSIALGTVPFGVRRAVQIALVFGFWDTVAPLAGGLLGQYVGESVGWVAEYAGPAVMGAYGLYLLVGAVRNPEPDELDHPWMTLFGLPLALSIDNLIAGTGLGLLGFPPVISAVTFGAVTAVMSFVGLCVGRATARAIPVRSDLLSALSLVTAAVVLPMVFS